MARRTIAVLGAEGDQPPAFVRQETDAVEWHWTDASGLAEALRGAEALVLWDFFSKAVVDVWPHCDSLRWIHVCAAGVDKLLFDELVASDVVVTNARGIFDRPIAEYVLAAVLAHDKQWLARHDNQRARVWDESEPTRTQGKRALVVGTGAIGREIGRLLAAIGLDVDGAARSARDGDADFRRVVSSGELADHLGEYDVVVNAVPLTPATRDLFDADVCAAFRSGAHFVNIGRGESVVDEALLEALRSGAPAAATLDVFSTEPPPDDHPYWSEPGVTMTGHMSGNVVGWLDDLADQTLDNARRYLEVDPDAGAQELEQALVNVVDKQLGFVPPGS